MHINTTVRQFVSIMMLLPCCHIVTVTAQDVKRMHMKLFLFTLPTFDQA